MLLHSWHPATSVTLFPSLTYSLLYDHCFPSGNSALIMTQISSILHYLCLFPLGFGKRCNCCLLLPEEDWIPPSHFLWSLACPLGVEMIRDEKQVKVNGNGKTVLKEPLRISVMPCRWGCDHFPHADLSFSVQSRAILRARLSHRPPWLL